MVTHVGGNASEDEQIRTYCKILDIILNGDAYNGGQDETNENDAETA